MTSPDPLRGNAHLVDSLGHALRSGEHGLSTVPGLIKRVLAEDAWREFVTQRGEHVEHERFVEFVTTPPLKGIGASPELLYRIAPDLEDELDKAFGRKIRSDKITANVDNIHDSDDLERPHGTSKRAALRRLRKDAPELHADVLAGRLSAHRAMVQAGFRPRTITVRTDDPERIAATLRRQLKPETISRLIELLDGR